MAQAAGDDRHSSLTKVLVAHYYIDTDSVKNYMSGHDTRSLLGRFAHVVNFPNHAGAVNVVRRDHHSIDGWRPACVFLYDTDRKTVYSGHQTVSWQEERKQLCVDIPLVDPRAPTTVIVIGVPYLWGTTEDGIKASMNLILENASCAVKSVQCLEAVGVAIVEFERSEDAMRVVNMEKVTVPVRHDIKYINATENQDGVWTNSSVGMPVHDWPVRVYVLRLLPYDPAEIPNTAHTATGVAASAARVGQTQAPERNQAPGAPVTPPRDEN